MLWRLDELPRETRVILICRHGYSSSLAAAQLQELGFADATDVIGGFEAWRAAGLPVQPGAGDQAVEPPPERRFAAGVDLHRREVVGVERALRLDHLGLDVLGREAVVSEAGEEVVHAVCASPPAPASRTTCAAWGSRLRFTTSSTTGLSWLGKMLITAAGTTWNRQADRRELDRQPAAARVADDHDRDAGTAEP